jgi:hypothetical protein
MHGKLLLCRKLMVYLHFQLLSSLALVLTGRLHGPQLRHSDCVELPCMLIASGHQPLQLHK